MTIRPATVADVSAVLPLVASVCAFHQQEDPAKYGFVPEPEKRYERWLTTRAGDPRSVFLVAERDGRVVGFIIGTPESDLGIYELKEYGFLHDLWVEPQYRHEGLGRQLVMLAIERFRQIGMKQVRLDVLSENGPAKKLFKSCGFRPAIIEMICEFDEPAETPQQHTEEQPPR
jgi:ribosomal protein S18 acetylase RimI-like enzyme